MGFFSSLLFVYEISRLSALRLGKSDGIRLIMAREISKIYAESGAQSWKLKKAPCANSKSSKMTPCAKAGSSKRHPVQRTLNIKWINIKQRLVQRRRVIVAVSVKSGGILLHEHLNSIKCKT